MTLMLMTACSVTPSDEAICDGTLEARTQAAEGALTDGGPLAKRSLNLLLDQLEAGCAE